MKKNRKGLSSPETVRERTVAHLEELLRAATVVGTGIVLACGAKAQTSNPPQVCDPLPPPSNCCANPEELLLRGCLSQHAQWMKSGTRWVVQLSLSAHAGPAQVSFEGLTRTAVQIFGVSIKDMKVEPRNLAFVLAAGASNRKANLRFPVLCNGKKVALKLVLDFTSAPAEKGSVPVSLAK